MASNKVERRVSQCGGSTSKAVGKADGAKINRACRQPVYPLVDLRISDLERAVYLDSYTSD